MITWFPGVLSWVYAYGYLAVWLILFIAAVGVPLPVDLVLLAAGAASAIGHFNLLLLAPVAISGSVCGDQLGYGLGRWWGRRLLIWLERSPRWRWLTARLITPAEAYFARRGGWAIFLSRFLVSSLGGEINLLAGADPFPYRRFLLADVAGETLGAVIPLSLGYVSGAKWKAVGNELGAASLGVLAVAILLILSVALVRTVGPPAHLQERTSGSHSPDHQSRQKPSRTSVGRNQLQKNSNKGVSVRAGSCREPHGTPGKEPG